MPVSICLDFELRGGHLTGRCRALCTSCGFTGRYASEPEASRQSREHNATCGEKRTDRDAEQLWSPAQVSL
jgi:hypothetical protein